MLVENLDNTFQVLGEPSQSFFLFTCNPFGGVNGFGYDRYSGVKLGGIIKDPQDNFHRSELGRVSPDPFKDLGSEVG